MLHRPRLLVPPLQSCAPTSEFILNFVCLHLVSYAVVQFQRVLGAWAVPEIHGEEVPAEAPPAAAPRALAAPGARARGARGRAKDTSE